MRILIVSDTHRYHENYLKIVEQWRPLDLVIHCGDVEGGEYLIRESAGCNVIFVQGNNDYFSDLPREAVMELGKYKTLITHGHQYYVNMGHDFLVKEARARRMDIVMYGHTHRPVIRQEKGILVINPGSLTYPRQEGRKPSYVIMEMEQGGEPVCTLHYAER